MANAAKTVSVDSAYEAIEAAGIRVWEGSDGSRRIYDPARRGVWATLEGGYFSGDLADYPVVKGGRCTGGFCRRLSAIIDGLKVDALAS